MFLLPMAILIDLPHNLMKEKLVDLIERIFQREGSLYIACNNRNALFTSDAVKNYRLVGGCDGGG